MIVDQFQESIFPGCADGTEVCDIDGKFTAVKKLFGLCVLAKEFGYPRLDENTFDLQSALAWAVNYRDLQHATLFLVGPRVQHAPQTLQL